MKKAIFVNNPISVFKNLVNLIPNEELSENDSIILIGFPAILEW